MNKKTKVLFLLLNIFLLFFFTIKAVIKEEGYKKQKSFYLKLAPVDPRSILQGDYMILNYDILSTAKSIIYNSNLENGFIIISIDKLKVAHFNSVSNKKVDEDSIKSISFSYNKFDVNIGTNTFLFQEGMTKDYNNSVYAEVVLINNSIRVLNLLDEDFNIISKIKKK